MIFKVPANPNQCLDSMIWFISPVCSSPYRLQGNDCSLSLVSCVTPLDNTCLALCHLLIILITMLNAPCNIPPIMGLQAEFKYDPLTPTCWAQPSNQFFTHLVVHPCRTRTFCFGYKNIVEEQVINLAEIKVILVSPPTKIYIFSWKAIK